VDETPNLVYVAAVGSHQVVALDGAADALLGWAAFHRGFGDPARPVPTRAIAVNPTIGPGGDGGHVWTTTSTGDGSESDQALLIPKGIDAYFHYPVPCDVGLHPTEGIAIDRSLDRAYVSSGSSPGAVTVLEDYATPPLVPFGESGDIGFEIYLAE